MQRVDIPTVDSTLAEAVRVVSSPSNGRGINPERPFAIVAREQMSPRLVAGGLWMTIAWPMRQPLADYQTAVLAADLALAEAIEPTAHRRVSLAWPGDLLLGEARVAAVRTKVIPPLNATRRPPTLMLTVAVYADLDPRELPRADYPQTSLRVEKADDPSPYHLLDRVVPRMRDRLIEHEHSGPTRYVIDRLRERLAFVGGERVRIEVAGTPREGQVLGLRDDGRLLADIDGHVFPVPSGRVFIPAAAPGGSAAAPGAGSPGGVGSDHSLWVQIPRRGEPAPTRTPESTS